VSTTAEAHDHAEPVYYFGCLGEVGHYLHTTGAKRWPRASLPDDFVRLFGRNGAGLDATMLPKQGAGSQKQGVAHLHHVDGWTVLAFWDRSVDNRGGSNSAFVTRGELDFATMLEASRATWPQVFNRFAFDIVEANS
jgi:hypothetical protein